MPQLRQDLTGRQVARKALMPRGAEPAANRATSLRGDAQSPTVFFGNEDRFHGVAAAHIKQPLDGAVGRVLPRQHGQASDPADRWKLLTQAAREVGHVLKI